MSSSLSRGPAAITLPPPVSRSVSSNFTGIAPPPIRARFERLDAWIVSYLRERCEAPARLRRARDVALLFIERDRLGGRLGRLIELVSCLQDLRKVHQRVRPVIQKIASLGQLHGLLGKTLCRPGLAAAYKDLCANAAPHDLRREIAVGRELLAALGQLLGFLVPSLRDNRLGQIRGRSREVRAFAHFLERFVSGAQALFGRGWVACQQLDNRHGVRNG